MLRRTLNEFVTSESGYVSPRTGLPVAWVVGLLLAAAVVLAPDPAEAACDVEIDWPNCDPQGCAQTCAEGYSSCTSGKCEPSVYEPEYDECHCS